MSVRKKGYTQRFLLIIASIAVFCYSASTVFACVDLDKNELMP